MPESKKLQRLTKPENQEKLRNARLCNNDKSALYLSRQCLRDGVKSLEFIGFLGWKRRIYTLFTPLEDRIGISKRVVIIQVDKKRILHSKSIKKSIVKKYD